MQTARSRDPQGPSLPLKLFRLAVMLAIAVGLPTGFVILVNRATAIDSGEYAESSIEYKLAAIDLDTTTPDEDSIRHYAELLDSISEACGKSRLQIGDMAAFLTDNEQNPSGNQQISILSFLTVFKPLAEGRGTSDCEDAAAMAATSLYG